MRYSLVKRFFDIFLVLIFLPFILTFILILAMAIILFLGWPVFYVQRRIGYQGKEFSIIKFRSMSNKRDEFGELLLDDLRLTKFGSFLRSSSLDEIPCLINVLLGHMSIVGPRPFISKYRNLYTREQFKRHDVIPGITGWAQVNGRNAISWEQKFEYDIFYVNNQSFLLDMKILWMTFIKVLAGKDINANQHTTMPEFMGSKNNFE
jgi:lipopolysaccharide/colanic/teichoic acid biosynthesis glycosyltransferase